MWIKRFTYQTRSNNRVYHNILSVSYSNRPYQILQFVQCSVIATDVDPAGAAEGGGAIFTPPLVLYGESRMKYTAGGMQTT